MTEFLKTVSKYKLSIIKVGLFLAGIVFMIIWTKISNEKSEEIWKRDNNMNPIKCSIEGKIDSIRQEGRSIYVGLNNGGKFFFKAKMYDSKNLIPDIISMIDTGDSIYKKQNSEIMTVKKKTTKDTIVFDMYPMDYGRLGCRD